ncbi:hypothetical protein A2230_00595 [candidate division WOR-1 bacterium RIFOXYA2_FULL_36_21]|uniref:Uncharacterized protein n=1 Tax=candidate division WOR-1 bacterium RIFOXYB2_FULL_36_35 TaxID=1802578 RepID=A0A1F4S301_UNCSA|nr:MAG: hypothetical protein A2230_00595 [candidate division WOR-1 bacterium RIFOXYA2_FULL_36_21]OGC14113.1 MAG: hypothetical protein A2290_06390 [candidate division WOR-1 bacterium RIFOXYB2_FULL_36_35]OGC16511.1 MAG: hypothetical protein A2282_02120 [candidate division WOR-1 bacterium RIFOXYA12_FULL_36_13]
MGKILAIIIVVFFICGSLFLYITKNSEKSAKVFSPNYINKIWREDHQVAIKLADQELIKHFPDKKNFGIEYKVEQVLREENPSIYEVVYNLPMGPTDQRIVIVVDIIDGKVMSYTKHHE